VVFSYNQASKEANMKINPELDLKLERIVDVPVELVWKAWTTPEHLMPWFCPLPWKTVACEMDLRPGGLFSTTMESPEGMKVPNVGCFLEVVENKKLVWTDALLPGFRPAAQLESGAGLVFTAFIMLEPHGTGTKYTAVCIHKDAQDKNRHEEMGFQEGWGIALDQLVAYVKKTF
jgi:uncharacterized protein YndB with AHSA1/START domain